MRHGGSGKKNFLYFPTLYMHMLERLFVSATRNERQRRNSMFSRVALCIVCAVAFLQNSAAQNEPLRTGNESTIVKIIGASSKPENIVVESVTTAEQSATTSVPQPTTTTSRPVTTSTTPRTTSRSPKSLIPTTKKPKPSFKKMLNRPVTTSTPVTISSDEESPEVKWKKFEESVQNGVESLLRRMLPEVLKLNARGGGNFTAQCISDFLKFVFAMRQLKGWAMRMVDSAGRPQAGIFYGAITDFGDYDECLDVKATDNSPYAAKKELFVGKYCMVLMQPALPHRPKSLNKANSVIHIGEQDTLLDELTANAHFFYHLRLRNGICVPSSCQTSDVQAFMSEVWRPLRLKVNVDHCEVKRDYSLEPYQYVCLGFISLMLLMVGVGTAVDLTNLCWSKKSAGKGGLSIRQPSTGKIMQIMQAFSLYANGSKLLSVSGGDSRLAALHGMRFISMTWVILGHTYTYFHLSGFRNISNLRDAPEDITFMAVLNGWVDVDTFFFLGGMALSYSVLKKSKGSKNINIGFYFFHRYWRLTPTFGLIIALLMLMPWVSSGPLWHEIVEQEIDRCRESWWASLLYVSNWRKLDQLCMTPTWYVSADFQLYIFALVILIPLLRWPSVGLLINFVCLMGSAVGLAILTLMRGFAPSLTHISPDDELLKKMVVEVHWKPYTHLGPYCVGIALGYFIYHQKKVEIKPLMQILGWTSSVVCALAVLYGAYDWNNGRMPNDMVTALYAACHRIAWALSMAWVVFVCVYGKGGFVNTFLSWKLFVPLSRLTFLMYMTHPFAMMVRYGTLRQAQYFGHYQMSYYFISHLFYTIGLSFIFSLLFEWPFAGLENIMFGKTSKPSRSDQSLNRPLEDDDDDLDKPNGIQDNTYSQYFSSGDDAIDRSRSPSTIGGAISRL